MEHLSQYQNIPPDTSIDFDEIDYQRDFTERFLDAGSSFDWMTPTYEAVRNIAQDGRSFFVHSGDWQPLKRELKRNKIAYWGEALHYMHGAYWYTFSVHADNADTVTELAGYAPTGGKGKAWLMVAVLIAMIGIVLALVAAVGGAM